MCNITVYPIANKFPGVLQLCVWIIELTVIHPLRVHLKSYSRIDTPFITPWSKSSSRELCKDLIPVFKLFHKHSVMPCVIIRDCRSPVWWTEGHDSDEDEEVTVCQSHQFYHHYFNLYSTSVPSEILIMMHSQTWVVIKLDIVIFLLITLHSHSSAQGIIPLNKHKIKVLLLISVLYSSVFCSRSLLLRE